MLPSVLQPNATDHVPVLAEEVRQFLAVQPGETVVDATFGSGGHAAVLAAVPPRCGEERRGRQIARAIVRRRRKEPYERTADLVGTIKGAIPTPARFGDGHPAKRVFQSLRIAVNDELGALENALPAALELLRPGG